MNERSRRIKRIKPKCPECKHAIFDETWGEYKCQVLKIRIPDITKYANCKNYAKKESKK